MCLGVPGQIISIDDAARQLGTVDIVGVRRQVNLACIVDQAHPLEHCIGAWVLVHVGFAMAIIDEAEAYATLQILNELGAAQREIEELQQAGGGGCG